MPIDPDIQRVIEIIDQRVGSLVKIKQMLLKEFGASETGVSGNSIPHGGHEPRKTRKDILVEFLKVNGPTLWGDILSKSGIPKGTLSSLIRDEETFMRHEGGTWDVVKEIKERVSTK